MGRLLREPPPPPPPPLALKMPALDKETLVSRSAEMAKAQARKAAAAHTVSTLAGVGNIPQQKSLWERVQKELVHYWHGTKLLGKEIKISTKLANRALHGSKLTRREQRQVKRKG